MDSIFEPKEEEIIIFEDRRLIVINKPFGWVTTNENVRELTTVENWLKNNRANSLFRNGILHRLDKGTSGLLMVAKDIGSWNFFKEEFSQRLVEKKYLALVGGKLPGEWQIKMPIGRSRRFFGRFEVRLDGKMAETHFRRVGWYKRWGGDCSLVEADLKTGRTHQIRVHLSYLRWPILGDIKYGGNRVDGLERQFLHASSIRFRHPDGRYLTFKSDLPRDLLDVLENYENKG